MSKCRVLILILTFLWLAITAPMWFAPRHADVEKVFRNAYFKAWYNTSLEDEETLSEEDVNGKTL